MFAFKKVCACELSQRHLLIQVHIKNINKSNYTLRLSQISEIMCNSPSRLYPSAGQEKQGFPEVKKPCCTLELTLFALCPGWMPFGIWDQVENLNHWTIRTSLSAAEVSTVRYKQSFDVLISLCLSSVIARLWFYFLLLFLGFLQVLQYLT